MLLLIETSISIIFPRMQNMARVAHTCAGIEPNYVTLSRPPEANSVTCEAKVARKCSEQMFQEALNRVLTLPQCGRGPALPESSGIWEKGWICVELWPFYCSKLISVPMSNISWWVIIGSLSWHLTSLWA